MSRHGGDPGEAARALGIKKAPPVKYDFSVNINTLGFPACVERAVSGPGALVAEYPMHDARDAEKALACSLGLKPGNLILGAGATEIFHLAAAALKPRRAAWSAPTYSGYAEICEKLGISGGPVLMIKRGDIFENDWRQLSLSKAEMIFLCSPNNPAGQTADRDAVESLAEENPGKTIILDESFMPFAEDGAKKTLLGRSKAKNLVVVQSLTKFFSIAGLRAGFAWSPSAETIAKMRAKRLPWSVNGPVQSVAGELFRDKDFARSSVAECSRLRKYLSEKISSVPGLEPYPSEANFILCEITAPGQTASKLQAELLMRGILIRSCANTLGLGERFIRLAARPGAETDALVSALGEIMGSKTPAKKRAPQAARKGAIMVVGTTSNAGKSLLCAGLCAYFARKGFKTAPFKAQNMALNSFVTADGGEIGRAQVTQAQAAGVEPVTDMNPVLLKPLGNAESQIIVNGKAIANMTAREYYASKKKISREAFAAFRRLRKEYDMIVLEGAGSPAEINLFDDDFVNMRMAEEAGCPAVLAADIDRGGVFASVYGTVKLLPPKWRRLLRGVIINKFRGDKSLLDSGIKEIEKLTGVPVLGVMPYIPNLSIEEEDSLGLEGREKKFSAGGGSPDIAAIRLPRLSNYTDLLALENSGAVNVRYVQGRADFGSPDLVVIPGSKNTIEDLRFLKSSGLEAKIKRASRAGVPVIGICGGYQMLGEKVLDPHGVESKTKELAGLGLLPVTTILEKEKELSRVKAEIITDSLPFAPKGAALEGYEIHAGVTKISAGGGAGEPLRMTLRNGKKVSVKAGCAVKNGMVFGCYIHGLFDSEAFSAPLISWLRKRKGSALAAVKPLSVAEAREKSFDAIVAAIKENLDTAALERLAMTKMR